MLRDTANRAPLLVADFLAASIVQDTAGALVNNTFRVALRLRSVLPMGTTLCFTGLTGFETTDELVKIQGNISEYTTQDGVWEKVPGRLNVTIAADVDAETFVILVFAFLNGRSEQVSPAIRIQTSGPLVIPPVLMLEVHDANVSQKRR